MRSTRSTRFGKGPDGSWLARLRSVTRCRSFRGPVRWRCRDDRLVGATGVCTSVDARNDLAWRCLSKSLWYLTSTQEPVAAPELALEERPWRYVGGTGTPAWAPVVPPSIEPLARRVPVREVVGVVNTVMPGVVQDIQESVPKLPRRLEHLFVIPLGEDLPFALPHPVERLRKPIPKAFLALAQRCRWTPRSRTGPRNDRDGPSMGPLSRAPPPTSASCGAWGRTPLEPTGTSPHRGPPGSCW